jgi:2-amino-4-hydroxy-6-hydroxymethyldihydropteridine diphosphokinase
VTSPPDSPAELPADSPTELPAESPAGPRVRKAPAHPVVIALGSNIEPRKNLPRALRALQRRLPVTAVSRVYETAPVGTASVPVFLNAAVRSATHRSPAEIKWRVLRPIEAELGRVRTGDRNAPRTLDLDLVLYGGLVLRDPQEGLTLPDPDLLTRAHLALPAADVAGELRHPETGKTLAEIAAAFRDAPGVRVLGPGEIDWPEVDPEGDPVDESRTE